MTLFTRDMFESDLDEAGVHFESFGPALVTWVAMQDRAHVTVAEAALAFNTTPEIIREAVHDAYWAFLNGEDSDPDQAIELEGE